MKQEVFKDKVIIVTGARQGIGKTLCKKLGTLGAKLLINSRDEAGLKKLEIELIEKGFQVHSVAGDISIENDCKRIVDEAISRYGKVDILINNAGISGMGNVKDSATIIFEKQVNVNLLGSYYMTKHALPSVIESKGSILFVSSLAAIYGLPNYSGYSCSKMALTALAQSLKLELHGKNVFVGVGFVGFTENDPQKAAYNYKGELEMIPDRGKIKKVTSDQTVDLLLNQIIKKKFISVHSTIGKLNWIFAKIFPSIIEIVLRRSMK